MIRILVVLLASGCATSGRQLLEVSDSECESFGEFDARVRARLDVLLSEAPGEVLVAQTSRLNAARRMCARRVLGRLSELREVEGFEPVQRELNALSATYGPDELRALMLDTLGPDAEVLQPLVLEAQQLAPAVPSEGAFDVCKESSPCEQTRCLLQQVSAAWEPSARKCLDDALNGEDQARRVAAVIEMLPERSSSVRTEALIRLETLRVQLWPEVEKAASARRLGLAAQLAVPFRSLPSVSSRVEALRRAAREHHVGRAREMAGSVLAQWIHLALAAEFGGDEAPALPESGTWGPARWQCGEPMPTLPMLPPGMVATLGVRCATKVDAKKEDESMRTFDLEKSLQRKRMTGSLTVSCAGRTKEYSLTVVDELGEELRALIERAQGECLSAHRAARGCAELSNTAPAEVITHFVERSRVNHYWEPCFLDWFIETEGALPGEGLLTSTNVVSTK